MMRTYCQVLFCLVWVSKQYIMVIVSLFPLGEIGEMLMRKRSEGKGW